VKEMRTIEVVSHHAEWAEQYIAEAKLLEAIFAGNLVSIHHFGSTAIPGIVAKPIIDILPVVKDIQAVDALNPQMEALGYHPKGEFGIPGRRYFFKGTPDEHTHHVHAFQQGNPEIERHLNFCAFLQAHPAEAQAYSQLKVELSRRFRHDPEGYTDGKSDLIRELDQKALAWAQANR
jgi:GrpB-like predicted nucleotidyltransferase (UPF0157 family)